MTLAELQELERRYVMQTYKRLPVDFVRGEGARLWDSEGREYLDFFTGVAVCSLGHCHPAVVEAVREQAGRLMHVSNHYYSEPAVRLAQRLSDSSIGGRAFFTNSGAEAVECAIKLARKHAHGRGVAQPEIVSFDGDFHGRTMGALAATPSLARDESFAPMLAGFRSVPLNDGEALREAVGPSTAAVMLEPIQGEAGVYPVSEEVLALVRQTCDEAGALLILDEIQTGVGRTGSLWAYEQTPVRPDLITVAKALGGGLPIGACVTNPQHGGVLAAGEHGSTFGGGPLVASAALAVLETVDDPELLRGVRELGARLASQLATLDGVREVRGRGLMLGVGLEEGIDSQALGDELLRGGLVVNVPEPGTLRLLPPLVIGDAEAEQAVEILGAALADAAQAAESTGRV